MTLCLSGDIVTEYVEVLQRLAVDEAELERLLSLFARGVNCVFAAHPPAVKVVEDDPDDDKFVACAVALKAAYVVSEDRDLTAVEAYMGIRIVTPRAFLDALSEALEG